MNDVAKKWEKTGLLEDCKTDKEKDELSSHLEDMALLLINKLNPIILDSDKLYGDGYVPSTILPIVVRIYGEKLKEVSMPDMEWLCYDYLSWLKTHWKLRDDLNSYIAMDAEAEMCCLYTDSIVKQITKLKIAI